VLSITGEMTAMGRRRNVNDDLASRRRVMA
jgi:hypothetical protein